MTSNILNVENLNVHYEIKPKPVKAVNKVSFNLKEKEILGICGESGCGKTTLLRAIGGLIRPPARITQGKILYKGLDLTKLSEKDFKKIRWRDISYIPQASMNSLNPVLKIRDQIFDVITEHHGNIILQKEIIEKSLINELDKVMLAPETLDSYPHELSGGMKQRVLVALAMGVHSLRPKIIIADEPTSNLDVTTERYILKILREFVQIYGASVIMVTHNIAAQSQIADRVVIMYAGEIVEIGDVYDIFNKPLHPYTIALISATPTMGGVKEMVSLPGIPPDLREPPSGCKFHPRCKFAIEGKCNIEEPQLAEIESGRFVKCHRI
ncbi:MAG: ABC transporter ATP-binding protein [Candidatus Bathyarchaeia archaeon]